MHNIARCFLVRNVHVGRAKTSNAAAPLVPFLGLHVIVGIDETW